MVITVPETINAGDVLTLNIDDAINPSLASGTYSITLVGNVTGLTSAPTTTSTPTTTTPPKPQPAVSALDDLGHGGQPGRQIGAALRHG